MNNLLLIVLLFLITNLIYAQSVTIKDSDDETLI